MTVMHRMGIQYWIAILFCVPLLVNGNYYGWMGDQLYPPNLIEIDENTGLVTTLYTFPLYDPSFLDYDCFTYSLNCSKQILTLVYAVPICFIG